MALITCPECKHQVSEHAAACPQCGFKLNAFTAGLLKIAQKTRRSDSHSTQMFNPKLTGRQAVAVVVGLMVVVFAVGYVQEQVFDKPRDAERAVAKAEAEKPKTAEELRLERIKKGLSSWDGSHIQLTALIKQSMNDPKSFEFDSIEVNYDGGDYLVITEKFRGKNAFGGVMPAWVKAKVDLDGNVLDIVDEGPK